MAKYRESQAFKNDVANGSVEIFEIFFSLLDKLACDYLTMDLSSYTLAGILRMLAHEDVGSCPPTHGPLVAHSLEALPIILEDRPFDDVEDEAEGEMDTLTVELNVVLIFDRAVPEEGEFNLIFNYYTS